MTPLELIAATDFKPCQVKEKNGKFGKMKEMK